jgi:hypothetical protein
MILRMLSPLRSSRWGAVDDAVEDGVGDGRVGDDLACASSTGTWLVIMVDPRW